MKGGPQGQCAKVSSREYASVWSCLNRTRQPGLARLYVFCYLSFSLRSPHLPLVLSHSLLLLSTFLPFYLSTSLSFYLSSSHSLVLSFSLCTSQAAIASPEEATRTLHHVERLTSAVLEYAGDIPAADMTWYTKRILLGGIIGVAEVQLVSGDGSLEDVLLFADRALRRLVL